MRFLCLHGLGTNSQVLETQLASIRHELGDYHTFEYVEGVQRCSIAPAIAPFYPHDGNYFAYFSSDRPSSFSKALDDLERYIEVEGPFDGVLGYSQGAQLAASLIIRTHRQDPNRHLFKCAIFLSGGIPCEVDETDARIQHMEPPEHGREISIPTAHIWGMNDDEHPGTAEALKCFYNEDWSSVYVHRGGHEIPGARSEVDLLGSVRAIRRVVDLELTLQ